MKRDFYAVVSARILTELENGPAPWVEPWSATAGANTPCNAVSNRPYSGCNVVLLWMAQAAGYRTPRFLTFKQASEMGGNVRLGERVTKVSPHGSAFKLFLIFSGAGLAVVYGIVVRGLLLRSYEFSSREHTAITRSYSADL